MSRREAMGGRPVKAPAVGAERREGKLYVTLEFERPRWQRALGADRLCRRTFGLDRYGQEVYGSCDGARPVSAIVEDFARRHHLSAAEAEVSVTSFLKTLMMKGLVGMALGESAGSGGGEEGP